AVILPIMKRFFSYSPAVWDYFQKTDEYFANNAPTRPLPASVAVSFPLPMNGIKAVIWDIYGTIMNANIGDLPETLTHHDQLATAAEKLLTEFNLHAAIQKRHPHKTPKLALADRYLELIDLSHQNSKAQGIDFPEVQIDKIWQKILRDLDDIDLQSIKKTTLTHYPLTIYNKMKQSEQACCMAYFFDRAFQLNTLYPQALKCLTVLHQANMQLGIISNAQFYTPIHLRALLRKASGQQHLELHHLFSEPLVLFSYELGYSKPNPGAFIKIKEILQKQSIEPSQAVFIGNDMLNDIWTAQQAGFKTILYAGDAHQTALRPNEPRCQNLKPNAIVHSMDQIIQLLVSTSKVTFRL
ncbi:MAG: HAD family hydrolase, partial [Phycisphaerae bacterium]|nr:HAD family hydrolase [Phycisphaerae bacterium]